MTIFRSSVLKKSIILFITILGVIVSACNTKPDTVNHTLTPINTLNTDAQDDSVKVGVLAIRSAVAANSQYGPILTYLEEELGRPFELVPLDQESQFVEVEQNNLDFVFSNPLSAVQLQRLYDTEFLVTLSRLNTGTEFGGLIIVNTQSNLVTVDDLRGQKGACVAFETAAAGCVFQIFYLQEQGFDPFEDFTSFVEVASQDNIVLGVLNGTYDVGFVRTGQLERMVKDGTILSIDELRIIGQVDGDFFYSHTTKLYPEWPLAALPQIDLQLKLDVTKALLAIPSDHPAMVTAGADGFVPAVDYISLDDLIITLRLRSWDTE